MPTVLLLGAASDMAVAIARKFASKKGITFNLRHVMCNDCKPIAIGSFNKISGFMQLIEFDALNFQSHASFFQNLSPKPDVMISVFGYLGENESARQDWKEAEKIIHSNYTGALSILNIVGNYFLEQKKGTIVGISSVAGESGATK